jgi:N-formylglutamate amidohydrolase
MFDGPLPSFVNSRSLRVAGGLGTIARVVGEAKDIYAQKLPVAEAFRRIDTLYVPWHRSLRSLLAEAHAQHGQAVLIDCHSMPSNAGRAERIKADIVLGDRFGHSCDPAIMDAADHILRHHGYEVTRNKPYAGGFITEHYGDPRQGWHALQIEINRALYMDEATLDLLATFDELRNHLREMIAAVIDAVEAPNDRALAAE